MNQLLLPVKSLGIIIRCPDEDIGKILLDLDNSQNRQLVLSPRLKFTIDEKSLQEENKIYKYAIYENIIICTILTFSMKKLIVIADWAHDSLHVRK